MSAVLPRFHIDNSAPDSIEVSGALLFDNAAEALAKLSDALPRGGVLRLNLAAVTAADSAGLACVLALMAVARRAGGRVQVQSLPEGLLALAKVSEVDVLLMPAAGA